MIDLNDMNYMHGHSDNFRLENLFKKANRHKRSGSAETLFLTCLAWSELWYLSLQVTTYKIPEGILQGGSTAVLHDAKVSSKRGQEDTIYDNHLDIRQKVARGNCFLEILSGPHAGQLKCLVSTTECSLWYSCHVLHSSLLTDLRWIYKKFYWPRN